MHDHADRAQYVVRVTSIPRTSITVRYHEVIPWLADKSHSLLVGVAKRVSNDQWSRILDFVFETRLAAESDWIFFDLDINNSGTIAFRHCLSRLDWYHLTYASAQYYLTYSFFVVSMTGFILLWFAIGLFLFASKVMAIRAVHNTWYYIWTGCSDHDMTVEVDLALLNEALFAEFLFESLPQMIVQSMNNTLTSLWNPIGTNCLVNTWSCAHPLLTRRYI